MPSVKTTVLGAASALALLSGNALAQAVPAENVEAAATHGGAVAPVAPSASVDECWSSWLAAQKLPNGRAMVAGPNEKPDGTLTYLAFSSSPILAQRGTSAWIAGRNAAFTVAELSARQQMAEFLGVDMRGDRGAAVFKGGEDQPPPDAGPARVLSNAEKLTTLTGKALDHAIEQFDPNWNGAGLTEEQKHMQAVEIRQTVVANVAVRAGLVAAGAFTIKECEGNDADGNYSVGTGLIWSPKLDDIARSMIDPRVKVAVTSPALPLHDQFAAEATTEPNWMAYTQGARVYTNEKGERVIVGFGVASGSGMSSVDIEQARVRALGAIQRFVGEKLETGREDGEQYQQRVLVSKKVETFDTGAFNNRVNARAREITLTGAYQVGQWRGKHPWGETPMQVVAMAYTPTAAASAAALRQQVSAAAEKAPPIRSDTASVAGGTPGPVAAPVHSGAAGQASDY